MPIYQIAGVLGQGGQEIETGRGGYASQLATDRDVSPPVPFRQETRGRGGSGPKSAASGFEEDPRAIMRDAKDPSVDPEMQQPLWAFLLMQLFLARRGGNCKCATYRAMVKEKANEIPIRT